MEMQWVLKGCKMCKPVGQMLNTLWLRRDSKETGLLSEHDRCIKWKKKNRNCWWEWEVGREGSEFLASKRTKFIFQDKCETFTRWINSNQSVIEVWSYSCAKGDAYLGYQTVLLISFVVFRCGSEPSLWWKWARALILGPDRHVCWPVSAPKISLSPPSSSSVIPSSLPWFPHLVYYYSIIASICLSSHRVDRDQEQKTVRARMQKEGRIFFFTPIQTHPLPALSSSHSPSSEQIKMLRSHFSLSVQEIIIQTDFWTASCTIRNSAALGRKMWFKLVLYCITIYSWSRLPSHTPSVSLQGCLVRVFISVWMHECTYKYNVYTHPGIYFVSYINFLWPLQDCQL